MCREKKGVLVAVCILVLAAAPLCVAAQRKWTLHGTAGEDKVFYSIVSRRSGVVRHWQKEVNGTATVDLVLGETRCRTREGRTLMRVTYRELMRPANGPAYWLSLDPPRSSENMKAAFLPLVPDSLGESLFEAVCGR